MNRLPFSFVLMLAALAAVALLVPAPATAQNDPQPQILAFELANPQATVSIADVEAGTATVEVIYEVSTLQPGQGVTFFGRVGNARVPLRQTILTSEVGILDVDVVHPLDFDTPALTIAVVDESQLAVLAEATIRVPYADDTDQPAPTISDFSANIIEIDVDALALGEAEFELSWEVENRLPNTNLRFIQVYDDRFSNSVEQPRFYPYITSTGTGLVTPRYQPDLRAVRLVIQLYDLTTGDVLAADGLQIPVTGTLSVVPLPVVNPTPQATPPASATPPSVTAPPNNNNASTTPPPDLPSISLQQAQPIEGSTAQ